MSNHDLLTDIRDSLQDLAPSLPTLAQEPRPLRAAAYALRALAESMHAIADAMATGEEPRRTVWTEDNPMPQVDDRVRCTGVVEYGATGTVFAKYPSDIYGWLPSIE